MRSKDGTRKGRVASRGGVCTDGAFGNWRRKSGVQSTMPPVAKRIAVFLSVVIVFAAWALTLDGYFESPPILRRVDPNRAEGIANSHNSAWENVSIRASDGVILRGWLFTPHTHHDRAVLLVHAGLETAVTC